MKQRRKNIFRNFETTFFGNTKTKRKYKKQNQIFKLAHYFSHETFGEKNINVKNKKTNKLKLNISFPVH